MRGGWGWQSVDEFSTCVSALPLSWLPEMSEAIRDKSDLMLYFKPHTGV